MNPLERRQSVDSARLEQDITTKTVENIVVHHIGALVDANPGKSYSLRRVFLTNLMRDSAMKLFELPSGMHTCNAEVQEADRETNHSRLRILSFLLIGEDLIPLNTHVLKEKNMIPVFKLSKDHTTYQLEGSLADYILDNLPEEVTLTRVLSEKEVGRYNTDGLVGSSHAFWEAGTVHTALHSISSEFINNEDYPKVIKFKFSKQQLKELLDISAIDISTYQWVFLKRDPNSPFPFDVEIAFKLGAHQVLIEAYKKWKNEQGNDSEDNPFAKYDEN